MKILVPLDGSPRSEAALPPAALIAGPLAAQVELLTVASPRRARQTPVTYAGRDPIVGATASGTRLSIPMLGDLIADPAESRAQAVERVEAELYDYLHTQAHALAGITTTARVVFADHPAEAIIARAREARVDLIAMATHGRSGLSHMVTGSIAEHVIRSGVAPVLVVRPPG